MMPTPPEARRAISDLESLVNEKCKELAALKRQYPQEVCNHRPGCPGSILNAYREGDVTFDDAVDELTNDGAAGRMRYAIDRILEICLGEGTHTTKLQRVAKLAMDATDDSRDGVVTIR